MMTIASQRRESASSHTTRTGLFVQSWLYGADASRSARRRLAAILRNACRTLGLKRGRGLGMLGFGGRFAGAVIVTALVVGDAGEAFAGNGIFINDAEDARCTVIIDDLPQPETTPAFKDIISRALVDTEACNPLNRMPSMAGSFLPPPRLWQTTPRRSTPSARLWAT